MHAHNKNANEERHCLPSKCQEYAATRALAPAYWAVRPPTNCVSVELLFITLAKSSTSKDTRKRTNDYFAIVALWPITKTQKTSTMRPLATWAPPGPTSSHGLLPMPARQRRLHVLVPAQLVPLLQAQLVQLGVAKHLHAPSTAHPRPGRTTPPQRHRLGRPWCLL